ncbi:MAG: hypothetical protein QM764_02115 [Chitinophagaceae bacterium]
MKIQLSLPSKMHYVLRIAVAMCFIGHGAFGIITKQIWCNYFAVFGIEQQLAYRLMPFVGIVDIVLGVFMLIYPFRFIPTWLVVWGIVTALLRPLSGEPFAEFIERAGNFGAPLALLILSGFSIKRKDLLKPVSSSFEPDEDVMIQLSVCLRVVVFLLLAGHGWLNMIGKKGLLAQYTSLGFTNPENVATVIGAFEIAAAFFVLIKPLRPVLIVLFAWKMFSEMFYPHYVLFEWIERGGSYGSILALWMIAGNYSLVTNRKKNRPLRKIPEPISLNIVAC